MDDLFLILFLVSLVCLIIGLIKPNLFSKITKTKLTRSKLALLFGGVTIASFILFNITTDPSGTKLESPTQQSTVTQTPEDTAKQKAEEEATAKKQAEDEAKRKAEEEAKRTTQPINLSGSGQQASSKFLLTSGLSIFKMSHNGSDNFSIMLLDESGKQIELLVNEIGSYNGSKAFGIKTESTYVLDVKASGKWSVIIDQPRPATAPETKTFSGSTQQATQLFFLTKGLKTFRMKHSGDGNFAPILLDKEGNPVELLANEIGYFNGPKALGILKDGNYVIDVRANGNWTISIE